MFEPDANTQEVCFLNIKDKLLANNQFTWIYDKPIYAWNLLYDWFVAKKKSCWSIM